MTCYKTNKLIDDTCQPFGCLQIYFQCVGEAALYILREEFGDNWAERVKVIFAGDDTTDEDAMRVRFLFIFSETFCDEQKETQFSYFNRISVVERSRNVVPCIGKARH